MKFRPILLAVAVLCCRFTSFGQHAGDTLLFTVPLNDDTGSIFRCVWNDKVGSTLAGPVMMVDGGLLLYSQHGYVLYGQDGKLLDSCSLFKVNGKAARRGDGLMQLAYPLDSMNILFYKQDKGSIEVFIKELFKNDLHKVTGPLADSYRDIATSQLFNLASNSITDEMSRKVYLKPLLVGFTSISERGRKWWTTDKFYSMTSPLIIENNGKLAGFFPGVKSDQKCDVKLHLVEPLGVFLSDDRWYYYGLFTPMGNKEDEYYQTLVLCDQAGNILYTNDVLKQETTDAELQKVEKINTIFTVRKAARYVFVPAIDQFGDIYYGAIDFERRAIEIYKRAFMRYTPEPCAPQYKDLFADQEGYSYEPAPLECYNTANKGVIAEVAKTTPGGLDILDLDKLTIDGYFVKLFRTTDEDLMKRISRKQGDFPDAVRKLQDTLIQLSSSWCPYGISLNTKEKGRLNYLHYGLDEVVQCARVIAVTSANEVMVRVDLDSRAEIVVFSTDGKYVNRFTFNRESYRKRKDVIVVTKDGDVFEKDYETSRDKPRYLRWVLRTSGIARKR